MGINRREALDCLRSHDLLGIGMEADALRRRLHPEGVVTYQCVYELDALSSGISIPPPTAAVRIRWAGPLDLLRISETCSSVRRNSPCIWLELSLPASVAGQAQIATAIDRWAADGVNSVTVEVRRREGNYAYMGTAALHLYRMVHKLGMKTSIGIPFGGGESLADRIDLLEGVRRLQDEFGGFVASAPVATDPPEGRELDGATGIERLKMLAVTRMYLDNIEHVQCPQVGPGLKVLQIGLQFG